MKSLGTLFPWLYNFTWRTVFILGLTSLLVAFIILTYQGINRLTTGWTEVTATPTGYSKIQERIREGEPEFFFKIQYEFIATGRKYEAANELGYRNFESAQKIAKSKMNESGVQIWYSSKNPNNVTFSKENTEWRDHLKASGSIILILIFSQWLYRKIWPTNHPFQRRAEPNKC